MLIIIIYESWILAFNVVRKVICSEVWIRMPVVVQFWLSYNVPRLFGETSFG